MTNQDQIVSEKLDSLDQHLRDMANQIAHITSNIQAITANRADQPVAQEDTH